MPVVARQPRQQAGAQKRRLAGAGRAEDHQQSRRRRLAQAAQPVERFEDRRVAAEENAGVLGFQRAEPAIRRTLRIAVGRPGEETRIEPGLDQPGACSRASPSCEKPTFTSSWVRGTFT